MSKKISIELGMTINRGNFNSVRPAVTVEGILEEGETYKQAYDRLSVEAETLWWELFEKECSMLTQASKGSA